MESGQGYFDYINSATSGSFTNNHWFHTASGQFYTPSINEKHQI